MIESVIDFCEPIKFEYKDEVLIKPPKTYSPAIPLSLMLPNHTTVRSDESIQVTEQLLLTWRRFRKAGPEVSVTSNGTSGFKQHIDRLNALTRPQGWVIQTTIAQVDRQPVNAYILHRFVLPENTVDGPDRALRQKNLEEAASEIPDVNSGIREFADRCAFYLSYLPEKDIALPTFITAARELVTKARSQSNLVRLVHNIISKYVPSLVNVPIDDDSELPPTVKDNFSALAMLCALEVYSDIANPSSLNFAGHGEAEAHMIRATIDRVDAGTRLGALLSGQEYHKLKNSDYQSISELRAEDLKIIFDRLSNSFSSVALTESASAQLLSGKPFNLSPQLLGIIEHYFELARIIRRGRAGTDDLNFTNQMMLEGLDLIIHNIGDGNLEGLMKQQRAMHEANLAAYAIARGSIDPKEMKKADREIPDRDKPKKSKKAV